MGEMGRRKWGNVGRQCRRPEIAGRSRKRGENGRNGEMGRRKWGVKFLVVLDGGNVSSEGKC
jgi:hypothetical protein